MPDTAIDPIPKQGKFRRALAAVGAWLQALDYTGFRWHGIEANARPPIRFSPRRSRAAALNPGRLALKLAARNAQAPAPSLISSR
jgi:hypothetical protein